MVLKVFNLFLNCKAIYHAINSDSFMSFYHLNINMFY